MQMKKRIRSNLATSNREMCKRRKDIPVILSSGYDEEDLKEQFVGEGLAGFLQKPYRIELLAQKLRDALPD